MFAYRATRRWAQVLVMVVSLSACLPASAAPDVVFSVIRSLGSVAKRHGILPLRIELQTKRPLKGVFEISLSSLSSVQMELPVNVGPGRFQYEVAFTVSGNSMNDPLTVTLRDSRGRSFGTKEVPFECFGVAPAWERPRVGLLMAWVGEEKVASERSSHRGYATVAGATMEVTSTVAEFLPRTAGLYDGIDALVLPAVSVVKLSPEQIDAIDQWVRSGGQVLVDGCAESLAMEKSGFFRQYGITPGTARNEANVAYRLTLRDTSRGEDTNTTVKLKLAVHGVSVRGVLCQDETRLREEIHVGLGRVVVTCVDLRAFMGSSDPSVAFLCDLIAGGPLQHRDDGENSDYMYYDYYNSGEWRASAPSWAPRLFLLTGLEKIAAPLVLAYLILFIVIVCPVERFVLGRLNRLRWTWWVTLATVLVFSVAAGGISYAARGVRPRRSMVCVHDYAVEGGGRHTLFDCFIPARSQSVTAPLGLRDVVRDVTGNGSGATAVFRLGDSEVEFTSPVWAPHFFHTSRFHDQAAPFRVDVVVRGGKPEATAESIVLGRNVANMWLAWNGRVYVMHREGALWKTDSPAVVESWREGKTTEPELDRFGSTRGRQGRLSADVVRREIVYDFLRAELAVGAGPARPGGGAVDSGRLAWFGFTEFPLGSPLTMGPKTRDEARLIAVGDEGESLAMAVRNPRVAALHVTRQNVRVNEP